MEGIEVPTPILPGRTSTRICLLIVEPQTEKSTTETLLFLSESGGYRHWNHAGMSLSFLNQCSAQSEAQELIV